MLRRRFMVLLLACALDSPMLIAGGGSNASHLNWGVLLLPSASSGPAASDLAHVQQVAQRSLDMTAEPVAELHLQGTLNRDPAHQASDRAKESFPAIFDLAVCARTAQEPLRAECLTKASSELTAWAHTYRATGNPINEEFMVPLFQAVDLIAPQLQPDQAKQLIDWVRTFADKGDEYYAPMSKGNSARINNWNAARLLIRAMAAFICDDPHMQTSTRALLDEFVEGNFVRGTDGVQDGETYDFIQRDALDYHVVDMLSLVQIALYTPSLIDDKTRIMIDRGLEFVRPYYVGEKQHIEFLHTTNSFDVERKEKDINNPAFQNKPWSPSAGRLLFRLARPVFPNVRSWTTNVVDEHYDERVNLLAAIYGDAASKESPVGVDSGSR